MARTGDGADDDDALERPLRRLLDLRQQQVGQQEVAQVVGACAAQGHRLTNLAFWEPCPDLCALIKYGGSDNQAPGLSLVPLL